MEIYQPMLFVGLGGTGCRIGAELERRLREELCGPDGTALRDQVQGLRPYQLPSCLQFVYADLAEDEFSNVQRRAVPDPQHTDAAEMTQHIVRELVPAYDTYPEVARSLRLNAASAVEDWLPPPEHEPRVSPLAKGAGQFPTVGRAALFETFRDSLAPVQEKLHEAVGRISNSGGQLMALGGRLRDSVDVFVAFSIAGGTGSGLFYDYLHLIGQVLNASKYKARIFPLVLMPSAFEEGMGGGRPARLNAGRSLLDLFGLVDDQNSQGAGTELGSEGITGTLSVRYPNRNEVRLRASTVQTAFLFSLSSGMQREDLHRSVVSLLLSLIGTDLPRDKEKDQPLDRNFQSFADSFINSAGERGSPSPTGVGKRGVSTSSVASMTVPVDDLADIVSSRLLADAVHEMSQPGPGTSESNREHVLLMFQHANIDPLLQRAPLSFPEPTAVDGAEAVLTALNHRKRLMEANIGNLERQLTTQVPELAAELDTHRAVSQMLVDLDLFRLRRVALGDPALPDEISRLGFAKLVESRRAEPGPPPGITMPGPVPDTGLRKWWKKVRYSDPPVRATLARQDLWYTWRAQRVWHAAWDDQTARWERKLRTMDTELTALCEAFLAHARTEDDRFSRRSRELYEERIGVCYLLPRSGELHTFYRSVFRRLVEMAVLQNRLRPTATAAELVGSILGQPGWTDVYAQLDKHGLKEGPARAVTKVRSAIKATVLQALRYADDGMPPLLPRLNDLVAAAAGVPNRQVNDDDLLQFREKLAALVPGGYAPQGSGRLKILFSYPSPGGTKEPKLESFLAGEVNLPRETETRVEFRPIDAESIVVVLFRSAMGLTEVPEIRDVLHEWSGALTGERPEDFLQWRQRTGYRYGYLATTPADRAQILHRLLCAAWNGDVLTTDGEDSPTRVNVRVGGSPVNMRLELDPYANQSSWSSLLAAYERWVLADSETIRRDFCQQLMLTQPRDLTRNVAKPAPLFGRLVDLAEREIKLIDDQLAQGRQSTRRRLLTLREFWAVTFPEAMDMPFRLEDAPQDNLRQLWEWMNG